MNTITILMFTAFAYATLLLIVIAQAIALNRIYRSLSWWYYIGAWTLLGVQQVVVLLVLPATIVAAQAKGELPEQLPPLLWLRILGGFLFLGLIIAAQDRNRRDLRSLEGDGLLRQYQKDKEADIKS